MTERNQPNLEKFIALARFIAEHADETQTLESLARRVHLSPSRLQRVFKSVFGVSPKKLSGIVDVTLSVLTQEAR